MKLRAFQLLKDEIVGQCLLPATLMKGCDRDAESRCLQNPDFTAMASFRVRCSEVPRSWLNCTRHRGRGTSVVASFDPNSQSNFVQLCLLWLFRDAMDLV